jgi:hypothetical protein
VFPGGNEDEKDAGGEEKQISARTGQNWRSDGVSSSSKELQV